MISKVSGRSCFGRKIMIHLFPVLRTGVIKFWDSNGKMGSDSYSTISFL